MNQHLAQVVDLMKNEHNQIYNMTVETAREHILSGKPGEVRHIEGSFALVARDGKTVRMARSMDRPMRYFLAKRQAGPALIVADRIDLIRDWLDAEGLAEQFHPSYTRMVPAHHIVEIQLVGCPDPDPTYTRFFTPERNSFSTDLDEIGLSYVSAMAAEIDKWLRLLPSHEPIGVCFSGGIDSGSVFLLTYHRMLEHGMDPGRLKAFTLSFGDGPDTDQARRFLDTLGLGLFLEVIDASPADIEVRETIRILEDYKPLDVECAAMGLALCRGIRARYPDWRYLIDGDGGDENLKDYPIEANPELTIRSVIDNPMLYQEGWGVDKIKHSLTYSGGLSRSYTRTYATGRHYGFQSFSPNTHPDVIEAAEKIPFAELTSYDVNRLYALKGDVIRQGVRLVTGMDMPVFPKRRFQHGAIREDRLHQHLPSHEVEYRKVFQTLYA